MITNFKLKHRIFNFGLAVAVICFCSQTYAQSYLGNSMDNYAGVHAVVYNPANVFDSPFRTDINLISASGYFGSDYLGLSLSDMLSADGEFNFDEDAERSPSNSNHFFTNIDVLGPSFMFNVGEKQSFAVTTRLRGLFNADNVNGNLYEKVSEGFEIGENFDFDSQDLNVTAHVFSEIGLTYGREVVKTQDQFLKAGITLKYLMGAGGIFMNSPELSGTFNGLTNNLTTQGAISYGSTPGFESDSPEFSDLQSGFGADIGVVYEYRKRIVDGTVLGKRAQQYKFKAALAITDIGSINYQNSQQTVYDANGDVNALEFETKDLEQVLEDNYTGTRTIGNQKLQLPTALQLMADYYIGNRWYVGLHQGLSLRKSGSADANGIINTTTVSPRWESKYFSVYSPLGLRQYSGFAWGLGFRLGPLTVGSGSILTNLISDNSKNTDIYVGLKIPLYKKIDY
ncbi:hypothetical protein FGM00_16510 [Aggregatimonas sangjinii]|uniref:DUF5723 domain-containing protein n=1 Tax=Aggregatimonas sangjinii TaxID=2583587 RepID=A0A5B7SXY6_9FLAO|nr:DUF5723 family protein [Aggregatimonas sangjinii]QCX01634.1 hypothetical protein FGM00_16510 [Aggregatimonas sangjinii]